MDRYNEQKQSNKTVDWRIKEALMFAFGCLRDQINHYQDTN
jgi:hypothetical protein